MYVGIDNGMDTSFNIRCALNATVAESFIKIFNRIYQYPKPLN